MRLEWGKVWGVLRVATVCVLVLSSGIMPASTLTSGHNLFAFASAPVLPAGPLEGPLPFLTVLCKFADVPDEPEPPAHFERLLGAQHPGLDAYWQEVSYGRISLAGSKVVGWLTLPRAKGAYVSLDGRPDFLKLAQDCGGLAGAQSGDEPYFGLNLVFNDDLGLPYGGRTCLRANTLTDCYGTTWFWPPYLHSQATWAHEIGHALGLSHTWRSGGRRYGDMWDVMSEDGGCAADDEFGLLAQHPMAFHKDRLGWIPESARLVLAAQGETTFKLAPLARLPAGPGSYLVAQVPIDGFGSHYYILEARTRAGFDGALLQDAVVIHEVEPFAEDERVARPKVTLRWQGSPSDDVAGRAFADVEHGIEVRVDGQAEDGFTVTVSMGSRANADGRPGPGAEAAALAAAPLATEPLSAGEAAAGGRGSGSVFAVGPGARQHALWTETGGGPTLSLRYATRVSGEEAWGSPVLVTGGLDAGAIAVPALAAGRNGTVYAAWSQLHGDKWQVRMAVLQDGASGWSEPETVSLGGRADGWAPVLAVGGRGRLSVAWIARYACAELRTMFDVLLRVRDDDGTWRPVERVDASPSFAFVRDLRLIVDAAGQVDVAWQELGSDGTHTYLGFRPYADWPEGEWQVARDERYDAGTARS